MKMTISNKLIIAFTLMTTLILATGAVGLYGAHQLKSITQFIVNEVWDTEHGAMEGTIGIQKQVILVEQVLRAENQRAEIRRVERDLLDAQDMTTQALSRLTAAGLMETKMIEELNKVLGQFYTSQKLLLESLLKTNFNGSEIQALIADHIKVRERLIHFLENLEEIANSTVENQAKEVDSITIFVDMLIISALVIGLCAAFIIAMICKKQISTPISMASQRLKEIANGNGDLSATLPIRGDDEISELSTNFNTFLLKIRETIKDVAQTSEKINTTSKRMTKIANKSSQGLSKQHAETEQVASATNEMASTVEEVARNAAAAALAATSANDEATKGRDIVVASTRNIDSLATQVKETTEIISHLEEDSNAIGSILDVIKDIAEQTNLLALNAAIEAARAGEMGRGFAVVADEVRNLAQRTQESTQEIQEMIEKLQTRAQNAARAMESGQNQAQSTVEQAYQAANALASIAEAVASINGMNMQIAAAAEEQSTVTEEINRNISNITQQAEETAQASQETTETGEQLATLANELNNCIRHFKF